MEDQGEQQVAQNPVSQAQESRDIGFPPAPRPKENSKLVKIGIAVVGVVVIVVVGGFLITRGVEEGGSASPTPSIERVGTLPQLPEATATPTATPTPTSTPVDKKDVKIEVLNGTGTPGEAAYLQDQLKDLGYTDIKVGNADTQDRTSTTVIFSKELSASVVNEITARLESIYDEVKSSRGTVSGDFDIRIVTGPRKSMTGSSPTPHPPTSPTASPSL